MKKKNDTHTYDMIGYAKQLQNDLKEFNGVDVTLDEIIKEHDLKPNELYVTNNELVLLEVLKNEKGAIKMETIKNVLMEEISDYNLAALVSECNGWNGSFEHLERFDMGHDLDMFAMGNDAYWLACRIHFGDFNPNDEYFNFDGLGNLQSFSEYKYNEMINDESEDIIETALELHEQGNIDIQWLIDEYVEEKE